MIRDAARALFGLMVLVATMWWLFWTELVLGVPKDPPWGDR